MIHKSVLLEETISGLALKKGDLLVDCTSGSAGHTKEACNRLGKEIKIVSMDADSEALSRSKTTLGDCDATFIHSNFARIKYALRENSVGRPDKILLDLGLSSDQLETSGRGFTFRKDEPLLMTFSNDSSGQTAMDIVNKSSQEDLEQIFKTYGEERFSRRIAEEIVESRKLKPITTTIQLVETIGRAVPKKFQFGRTHFATRVFQALRIATNDEINSLKTVLRDGFEILKPEGRMAVISFHSLEDREVKTFFKQLAAEGKGILITKRPIVPTDEETETNPRSRSAKLRIIEKSNETDPNDNIEA